MPLLYKNPSNPLLAEQTFKINSEYTRAQWVGIVVIWIILLPVAIPLWVFAKCLAGVLICSGAMTFWIAERLFHSIPDRSPEFRCQFVRAYINNCVAAQLPHWNAPFRRFLFRLTGVRLGRGGFIGMGGYMED